MANILPFLPASILSAEFLFGGYVRLFPWPFTQIHERVLNKNAKIAPVLYPFVPFRDVLRHNQWVGVWMMFTGVLLAHRKTVWRNETLGLVLFWTGAGGWSQWMCGMPFWLPVTNALLGCTVWWIENRYRRASGMI